MKELFLIAILIGAGFLISKMFGGGFPVKYYVCQRGLVNCHVVAKFKDREDCETTARKWGWYCDTRDKSNIVCKEKESTISDSYCSR